MTHPIERILCNSAGAYSEYYVLNPTQNEHGVAATLCDGHQKIQCLVKEGPSSPALALLGHPQTLIKIWKCGLERTLTSLVFVVITAFEIVSYPTDPLPDCPPCVMSDRGLFDWKDEKFFALSQQTQASANSTAVQSPTKDPCLLTLRLCQFSGRVDEIVEDAVPGGTPFKDVHLSTKTRRFIVRFWPDSFDFVDQIERGLAYRFENMYRRDSTQSGAVYVFRAESRVVLMPDAHQLPDDDFLETPGNETRSQSIAERGELIHTQWPHHYPPNEYRGRFVFRGDDFDPMKFCQKWCPEHMRRLDLDGRCPGSGNTAFVWAYFFTVLLTDESRLWLRAKVFQGGKSLLGMEASEFVQLREAERRAIVNNLIGREFDMLLFPCNGDIILGEVSVPQATPHPVAGSPVLSQSVPV